MCEGEYFTCYLFIFSFSFLLVSCATSARRNNLMLAGACFCWKESKDLGRMIC